MQIVTVHMHSLDTERVLSTSTCVQSNFSRPPPSCNHHFPLPHPPLPIGKEVSLLAILLQTQAKQIDSKDLQGFLPLPGRDCNTFGRLTAWASTSSSSRSSPSSYMNPLQAIVGWCMPRCFFNTCTESQMHTANCAGHPDVHFCNVSCRHTLAKGICILYHACSAQ